MKEANDFYITPDPDIYDKKLKRQELIWYCERLEGRLEREKEKGKFSFLMFIVYYSIFWIGFMLGWGTMINGMANFSPKNFEWFQSIVLLLISSPFAIFFIKTIYQER